MQMYFELTGKFVIGIDLGDMVVYFDADVDMVVCFDADVDMLDEEGIEVMALALMAGLVHTGIAEGICMVCVVVEIFA